MAQTALVCQKYVRKQGSLWSLCGTNYTHLTEAYQQTKVSLWHALLSSVKTMSANKGLFVACTTLIGQNYVSKQRSLCGMHYTHRSNLCQQTTVSLWHALHSSVKTMSANNGLFVACITLIGQNYVSKQRSLCGMHYTHRSNLCQQTTVSLWHALHASVKTMSANKGLFVACTTLIGQNYVSKQRPLCGMHYTRRSEICQKTKIS